MFEGYPKVRPELPPEYARIYTAHYKDNRGGATPATSISKRMESWLHKQVAADIRADHSPQATLEIGAGTLNQLDYEPSVGPYDIVEPFKELYEGAPSIGRIRRIFDDIAAIPLVPQYDRITSIATFEHICNLPEVIARTGILLDPNGGRLRVSIPSEGTALWALGWKLTTGIEFRLKHGLDYSLLMRYEHVNTAREIESILRHFYDDVRVAVFGIARALSFYQFYECARPDPVKCLEFLAHLPVGGSGK